MLARIPSLPALCSLGLALVLVGCDQLGTVEDTGASGSGSGDEGGGDEGDGDEGGGDEGGGDEGGEDDTGEGPLVTEHCGTISADETWAAGSHLVTCEVAVESGTLTIEAGADVVFEVATLLSVGGGESPATLVVSGSDSAPVQLRSDDEGDGAGAWVGLQLLDNSADSSLSNVTLSNGGKSNRAAVYIQGSEVLVDNVDASGSAGCGLSLRKGGSLAEGSQGLVLHDNEGASACTTVDQAHTLPSEGSSYTGNGADQITVDDEDLAESVTWRSLGVPYVVTETVKVSGTAGAPAVLSIEAPNTLLFGTNKKLRISPDGGAGGLIVDGTVADPVLFSAQGSAEAGSWDGIEISQGAVTGELLLRNVELEYGGAKLDAALSVEDAEILVDGLTIHDSASAGIGLSGRATFATGSQDLVSTGNARAIYIEPSAMHTLPTSGLDLTGNEDDAIWLQSDEGIISEAVTWTDLGADYVVDTNLKLEGTAEDPAVLTLAEGVNLRFRSAKGLFVSKSGGAAGLLAQGSSEDPVTFGPNDSYTEGSWGGLGFYDGASTDDCVLEHFEVSYGGGTGVSGAVHVKDTTVTLRNGSIHHSEEDGVYSDDGTIIAEDLVCSDNLGDDGPGCNE